jgi:hypothetical protein
MIQNKIELNQYFTLKVFIILKFFYSKNLQENSIETNDSISKNMENNNSKKSKIIFKINHKPKDSTKYL